MVWFPLSPFEASSRLAAAACARDGVPTGVAVAALTGDAAHLAGGDPCAAVDGVIDWHAS